MQIPSEISQGKVIHVPAGSSLFKQAAPCENFVLLKRGYVRVFSRAESGKEALLYRLAPNEMCVLSASCLIGDTHYTAEAIAETDIELIVLDKATFKHYLYSHPEFNQYVFHNLSQKFNLFVHRFEQVQGVNVMQRLRDWLANFESGYEVVITHQELAVEIGSAREVISRNLKLLANEGLICLKRGSIEII